MGLYDTVDHLYHTVELFLFLDEDEEAFLGVIFGVTSFPSSFPSFFPSFFPFWFSFSFGDTFFASVMFRFFMSPIFICFVVFGIFAALSVFRSLFSIFSSGRLASLLMLVVVVVVVVLTFETLCTGFRCTEGCGLGVGFCTGVGGLGGDGFRFTEVVFFRTNACG